jgi:hypothetical protein
MSNQYLVFSNPGEIDPRLITTLGVNVKAVAEGQSPIGFFGTGLKYAIAVVLRSGGQVVVNSGHRQMAFSAAPQTIRGKEFQLVQMASSIDGPVTYTELGFTLDLGRNWQPWMAIRELWANAQDELGTVLVTGVPPAPKAGQTTIVVSGEALLQAWSTRHTWLLESNPVGLAGDLEVHPGPGLVGYYHGIRVCDLPAPGMHTYNYTGSLRLTEDRTVDLWEFRQAVTKQLSMACEDEALLTDLMLPEHKSFEDQMQWEYCWNRPSETMQAVAERVFDSHPGTMHSGMVKYLQQHMPKRQPPLVQLTKVEQAMLDRALVFLAKLGHPVSAPIKVIETLGDHWISGLATPDGEIWLPKATFGKGTKYVSSTLLEEHLHIVQHLPDCSRAMQDWLFDRVMSLGEELQGEPL